MINGFMSMETITRGLLIQQLEQQITASNLANPSQDAQGYLINSLESLNVTSGTPLTFNGPNGNLAVGTGPLAQSITRLRSSFLDAQIQQESSILGKAEILSNTLSQINGIVNGSTTLNGALTTFANAWTALASNPLNTGLRAAVVNAGVAFAQLSNSQYTQLENLQVGMNGQINQTVSTINGLLQQLSSINRQLLNSQGSNPDPLLDARDYALDKLARLVNIQVNFGVAGTATVYLGSSSYDLVDPAGASILQTNAMNGHNPGLVNVTLQSSEGTMWGDITNWIVGGNLSGELQSRDVALEAYKDQVDQIATSVLNVTNDLHASGYAANGTTTGTPFFTGTGAVDISVNASLITDSTHSLLAASNLQGVTSNGQIAQFLGNLPTILANNFIESNPGVNLGGTVDPTQPIGTQSFAVAPNGGSFTVNGVTITYTTANTIDDVLSMINSSVPNVYAVFNSTTQQFFMFSNNPITIAEIGGDNFTAWGNIHNVLTSTIRVNNGFAPTSPNIVFGGANSALNSILPGVAFNSGPNSQAYRVTPSASGTFTIDGIQFNWNNTQSLSTIRTMINTYAWAAAGKSQISLGFSSSSQTVTLFSSNPPTPIQIVDNTGNFTVFTGLNGNTPIGNLTSGVLNSVSSDLSTQQLLQSQASDSLTQLNNAQANIAGVATSGNQAGVPLANIQQQAVQSLISYNALLQVLQVIDNMYSDLVNVVGGAPSASFFQPRP